MKIPFEPQIFGYLIPVHLVLEYAAFFIAFRYYVYLKRNEQDAISKSHRLSIILGAAIGAFLGSRILGFLEAPNVHFSEISLIQVFNSKTIMGGLFGGLIGVELIKKYIGEKKSSGDLFVFPLIVGIFIGRIGCFLSGINEFTYGKATHSVFGMDLGDGVLRHPTALYELVFLIFLFLFLKQLKKPLAGTSGALFKWFMILYFTFRFFIEFLKPNVFFVFGLSSIQILCLICILYYNKTILAALKHAY